MSDKIFGCALAMAVLQSPLYRQLDDKERAECDELISRWVDNLRTQIEAEYSIAPALTPADFELAASIAAIREQPMEAL